MRVGRLIAGRADLAIGAGFAAAWLVEALIRDGGDALRLALDLPGVAVLLCLALRRRRPLVTTAVFALGFSASSLLDLAVGAPSGDVVVPILGLLVAVYSLGAHASRAGVFLGAPLALLPVVVADLTSEGRVSYSLASGVAFFAVFVVVLPVLAGRLVRGRARLAARLGEQERELVRRRAAATEAALAEERMQLAGRLDAELIAGTAALVADAGRAADPSRPDRRELIEAIERRARALLTTTRSVVVSLADDSAPDPEPHAAPTGDAVPPAAPPAREDSWGVAWSALAAAALGVGMMIEVPTAAVQVPGPVALLACLVVAAPLALAWRWPLPATVAVEAAAAGFSAVVVPMPALFAAIGLSVLPPFFVAAFSGRRGAVAGLAVCCAGQLLTVGGAASLSDLPMLLLAWLAGLVLAERGRLVARLRETTALLAEGRAAALRAAVLEERARVARDLHDSAGHRLTVLALHASAARRLWDADRGRAEGAVATIARVAAEALTELRQGYATGGAGPDDGPGLAELAGLVDGARAAGLPVRLAVEGPAAVVPSGTQTTAYRVVQEALTNVLRHAPGAVVTAEVRCLGDRLLVDVVNGAPAPVRAGDGARPAGTGLAGLRSRVESCGGRLEWGTRPEGGFAVRAEFPLAVVPA